jgi:acyl-CoA thioesterase I
VSGGRRFALHAVVVLACAILVSGCLSSATPPSSTHRETWSVVALGDSVPRGSQCGCTPYPELSASLLTVPATRVVTATNDAVAGSTSADLLAQLRSDPDVISHVEQADVVEIEVGANDVAYGGACGTSIACYRPMIPAIRHNLADIVARVHQLTEGRPVLLVLLDYWNVWLGGQYAEARGLDYVDAADAVTDQVNAIIKGTAAATGSVYVDLRAAFKGPDYSDDETSYLASDGDHPNTAGHEQIAAAVVDVITETLRL